MKLTLHILVVLFVAQSCSISKINIPIKDLDLNAIFIQKVIPGTQEEAPYFRIVFEADSEVVTSLDSASYNNKTLIINAISKNDYEMIVPNSDKKTPFKVYYNISGEQYCTIVKHLDNKDPEYRP